MLLKSVIILICLCGQSFERKVEVFMPNIQPTEYDQYLGLVHTFNDDEINYLVNVEMIAESESVHHINMFFTNELSDRYLNGVFKTETLYYEILRTNSLTFLTGWAINTIPVKYPEEYGILLKKYFIIEIHYYNVTRYRNGATDNSGVILTVVPKVEKRMAMLTLFALGSIGPHQTVCWDLYFHIKQPIVMPLLFALLHTHSLGQVAACYVVRNGTWTLITKGDPYSSHNVHNVMDKNLTAKEDDFIATRCTYVSDRDKWTYSGFRFMNEMCQISLLYSVDEGNYLNESMYMSLRRWKDDNRVTLPEWVDRDSRELYE